MRTNATNDEGPPNAEKPRITSFVVRHSSFAAFTLIEIMVVVAIMGIILAAGIPSLYGMLHKEGFRRTMSDLVETCQSARATAIMSGTPSELTIHPRDGIVEASGGGSAGYGSWAHTAKIEGGRIEALKINNSKDDYSQFQEVKVRFFPNGRCDEMTMILISDKNELRGINLEITTGIATVLNETDVRNLAR